MSSEIKTSFPMATSPPQRRDLPCSAQASWLSPSFELRGPKLAERARRVLTKRDCAAHRPRRTKAIPGSHR
jgi:hypothetical protein